MSFDNFAREAWASAYPVWDELSRVLWDVLHEKLDDITPPKAMDNVRLELFQSLNNRGKLREFLLGTRKATPNNYRLRNASWLFDLQQLLRNDDAWRDAALRILVQLPSPGLGKRRNADRPIIDLVVALAGEEDWRDDTVPHVPLLDFMHLFTEEVDKVDQQVAAPLRQWIDRSIADLGWSPADIDRLRFGWSRLAKRPKAEGIARLLVRVRPFPPPDDKDVNGNDVYAVKAWLADTADPRPLLGGEEHRALKHELCGLIDKCRRELGKAGLRPDQVRMELTLSRALLGESIDQCKDPEDDTPLGSLHSLVLRCWERLNNDGWSAELGRHLEHFDNSERKLIPIEDLDAPTGVDLEALWIAANRLGGAGLRVGLLKRAQCCVCILEKAPQTTVEDPKTDLLFTLLRAGIPGILWARNQPPTTGAALRQEFEHLLESAASLRGLPQAVNKNRSEAVDCTAAWHLGRHIALIWDDPHYPPSPEDNYTFRLQSPAS